jgi:hypothetical protein
MADLTPFATKTELAAYWRTLTAEEQTRADVLLLLASNKLRLLADSESIDLDEKVTDSEAFKTTIRWVVMEAVKRAMQTGVDQPSVESYQQTAGPYSENFKYVNPTGDLFFRKAELASLGLSGQQTLKAFMLAPESYYS